MPTSVVPDFLKVVFSLVGNFLEDYLYPLNIPILLDPAATMRGT